VFVEECSTTGENITNEVMWQFAKDSRYWDLAQTTINATGNFKIVFEGSATWPAAGKLIMKLLLGKFGSFCVMKMSICQNSLYVLRLCACTIQKS